jgi:RNA 3'-terminal phosphate cyclase (ATP)
MIEIDGSQGEGGGQVLRTSLAFSILTAEPIRVFNVRAKRRNPGLAPQHLAGILAAARICRAQTGGVELGSTEIRFQPGGPAQPGEYTFDISALSGRGSAGAVTLLLQAIWLPLALSEGSSRLVLRGGTHVNWSPPVHYLDWVLFPTLARLGVEAAIHLETWGWYPKGGGQVTVTIRGGAHLRGVDLTQRGSLVGVKGVAAVSNLPSHIPQRISNRANNLLREAGLPAGVQPQRTGGPSTGAGLFMALEYEHCCAGFTSLGERGKPSEKVANEAAGDLIAHHKQEAALDRYLPDQIVAALALAEGPSALGTTAITRHTLTNVRIIRRFVEREIVVEGAEGQPGFVRVKGDAPPLP